MSNDFRSIVDAENTKKPCFQIGARLVQCLRTPETRTPTGYLPRQECIPLKRGVEAMPLKFAVQALTELK